MMKISYRLDDYDYDLPPERIAQYPSAKREESRLLVMDRSSKSLGHRHFRDIVEYLGAGDILVLNDTRVVPSRLYGAKETGGKIELLVLDPYRIPSPGEIPAYQCLVKCSKPPRVGARLLLPNNLQATVVSPVSQGRCAVRFETDRPLLELLHDIGHVPLPPYIRREGDSGAVDDERAYQTVYASSPGAVAAPTAGLHFSQSLLRQLQQKKVECLRITLHVGYGTFSPVRARDIRNHRMHSEYVEISASTAERLNEGLTTGKRIIAVGTTVVRTLEWAAGHGGIRSLAGECDHYIYPGYHFRIVDAMITNFHLPKSSLLLLVCAFAGRGPILSAYREAIEQGYRFYSYGDAMLIF